MGYVHDTGMSQYIPPTAFHMPNGAATFVHAAGAVTDTIVLKRTSHNSTGTINIPVMVPSNSVAQKGAYLKSIEIDYEILDAAATGVTWIVNKVTRGADLAVAGVAPLAYTQTPTIAVCDDQDQHRAVLTLTVPAWMDNDDYVIVEMTFVAGASAVLDLLGAVANFTLRV